jgi:flagellar hook-length control protein FliK
VPEPAETPHAAARSFLEVSSHPIEPRRAEAPKPEPPSRAIAAVGESRPRESHPEAVARPAEAESRPAAAASEASAPDAMVERAALHMSASGNTIELLLRAEHLGRVAVRLIERAGVIEVAVRSDSQPLRTLLAESLPSLVQTLDERGWQVARSAAGGETGLNWWTGADQQKRDRYQGEAKQRRALPGRGDPKFDVLNEVLNHD